MATTSLPESHLPFPPIGYGDFLEGIKKKIREAQLRASLSVNAELIKLYWSIGMSILEKQRAERVGEQKSSIEWQEILLPTFLGSLVFLSET